ncbi:MAG: cyclic pyranopterin monophosphate synthase MoaC [Clostridiales bacterium]|nr:cyclic pyranopterin monophosphate synthase MoaC [Clostridiales bacterium]MCF8021471.1 cyclic pyranopterin monophosphate synthase MoaC [Clostridiales bacterium]
MPGFPELNHLDSQGRARMVDVSCKGDTLREAVARGEISMNSQALELIREGKVEKGEVLNVARVAGIMAAKQTGHLIPMTHPLVLTGIDVNFKFKTDDTIEIESRVRNTGKTGVEMEALTAVSVAALTVYDMVKSADKEMIISNIHLVHKSGGKSGHYDKEGEEPWS